jgi:hypothetical protein
MLADGPALNGAEGRAALVERYASPSRLRHGARAAVAG